MTLFFKSFSSSSLFLFLSHCCLKNYSISFQWFSLPLCFCPCQLRPCFTFSLCSFTFSPLPFISYIFFSLRFLLASRRKIKMSAGGTGQAVCLHLIITVPYSPAGGHAALIVDETRHMHVVTHSEPTVTNTRITPIKPPFLYLLSPVSAFC